MHRGRLLRYRVAADGTSTLCETHSPVWRHVWWRRLTVGAGVVFAAGLTVPFVVVAIASALGFGPIDLDRAGAWATFVGGACAAAFAGAFLLLMIGVVVCGNVGVVDGLGAAKWDVKQWNEVPKVAGRAPSTRAQLEAAERLAATHEGNAFARSLSDGTAEVVATSGGRLYRYVVGDGGDATMIERSGVRARYYIGLAFLALSAVGFVIFFVAAFAGARDRVILLWLFGGVMASMLVGHGLCADFRAARLATPREGWLEIRFTRPDIGPRSAGARRRKHKMAPQPVLRRVDRTLAHVRGSGRPAPQRYLLVYRTERTCPN
jgi:hypothetical protein